MSRIPMISFPFGAQYQWLTNYRNETRHSKQPKIEIKNDINPYEFGSTLAAAVPGSEDLHFDCDWLRDSSWAQPSQWEFSIYC